MIIDEGRRGDALDAPHCAPHCAPDAPHCAPHCADHWPRIDELRINKLSLNCSRGEVKDKPLKILMIWWERNPPDDLSDEYEIHHQLAISVKSRRMAIHLLLFLCRSEVVMLTPQAIRCCLSMIKREGKMREGEIGLTRPSSEYIGSGLAGNVVPTVIDLSLYP